MPSPLSVLCIHLVLSGVVRHPRSSALLFPNGVESLAVGIHPPSNGSAKPTGIPGHGPALTPISSVISHGYSSDTLGQSPSSCLESTRTYLTRTSTYSDLAESCPLATGNPSSHRLSTNISSVTINYSESTSTHTKPGLHSPSIQLRAENIFHGVAPTPPATALPSTMSSRYPYLASNTRKTVSNHSTTIPKLNASFPRQGCSAQVANPISAINLWNGERSSALSNISEVVRPNSSALHQDHSTTEPSASVHKVSGTARSLILALDNSTRVSDSAAPEIIRQSLNFSSQKNNSMGAVDLTGQLCTELVSSNGSAHCNLTSDPSISFNDLKVVTATFNYSDYFEDLNDLKISVDEPEIPDIEYFEMTPFTIMNSRTFEWYSSWSAIRQGTPDWNKNGEWKLFYMEFFGESNFGCSVDTADCSLSVPKIDEIRQMFPDNRPLGRRVLFVAHIFKMMHDLANRVDERFTVVEVHFRTLIKDLVETFTLQVDQDLEAKCKTIHTIIEESVNLVVNTALSVLTDGLASGTTSFIFNQLDEKMFHEAQKAVENAVQSVESTGATIITEAKPETPAMTVGLVPTLKKIWNDNRSKIKPKTKEWAMEVYKAARTALVTPWLHVPQTTNNYLDWQAKEFPQATPEDVTWRNAFVNDAYKAWPSNQLKQNYEHPDTGLRGGGVPLPKIVGGKTSDGLCSAFGGDWKDLNAKNYDLVAERVSAELAKGRVQVQNLFKAMVKGAAPEVGAPSMVARWMLARSWVGKEVSGTVEYDLNNAVHFNSDFEIAFVKELASSTLASGYNYMKCSHEKDSAEKCGKVGDRYESIICPRPETDPGLVCQTGRWYFGKYPHETVMDAIRKVEDFGHLHGLQFSRRDMLQEIYDNYEKHGNKAYEPAWGFDSFNSLQPPRGFHLPVCMLDGQPLTEWEFQRPWQHNWDFPAICGNHAANETAEVMMGLGLDPESPNHHHATFTNRVPHLLAHRGERPFTVYMTLCELGMRWPNKDEFERIRTDKDLPKWCWGEGHPDCLDLPYGDRDCGLVRTATSHMTSDEANLWFCTNAGGHTIFERQREWVWVPQIEFEDLIPDGGWFAYGFWWRYPKYHCGKWLTRGEGQTHQALAVITNQTLGG